MKSNKGTFRVLSLAAASAAALLSGASQGHAQQIDQSASEAAQVHFNIAAQPLTSALMEFSRQARVTVVAPSDLVRGRQSAGVVGEMSPDAALARLISGSGLRVQRTSDGGLGLIAENDASPTRLGAGDELAPSDNEEIVVTGTLIRGLSNETAPVTTYDRDAIDQSGYATTDDFIRSMTQNFKGGAEGASQDGVINSTNGLVNLESASGVNLRGLGTSSTLVLLNGHRMAPSALGAVIDVSTIPLGAIERIEVLTDGASSIYGADAVGGVVNFVLRRNYEGAETAARYAIAEDRSQILLDQSFGRAWGGGSGLIALHSEHADDLASADRAYTSSIAQPTDLYPEVDRLSAFISLQQALTSDVTVSSDILYSHTDTERDFTDPFRSLTSDTSSETLTANLNVAWDISSTWQIRASGLYSNLDTARRNNYYTAPPVGYVNGELAARQTFELAEGSLIADGVLLQLPAGDARLAVGGSHREEHFETIVPYAASFRSRDRTVGAVFGELFVPVVGREQNIPLMDELVLSASVRYDDYSDAGDTTNPRIGLMWAPIADLHIRASLGSAFRSPNVSEQLVNAANLAVFTFPFAAPGGGFADTLVVSGAQQLLPEESENVSIGVEYRPSQLPDLTLSVNLFQITYKNRLISPPFDTDALVRPEIYGSLVSTLSSDAETQAYVADLVASGFAFYDLTGSNLIGVQYLYTGGGMINAARVDTSGYDLALSYVFGFGEDELAASLSATVIDEIETAFCDGCLATDLVNTYGEPLRLRARGALAWTGDEWQVAGAVNYANGYTDTMASPDGRIDAWTTIDLNVRYAPNFLDDVELTLGASNLFDQAPPRTSAGVLFSGFQYDAANADPLGRVVSLSIRKSW
ncbi:TonB-dependent receptor [Terricaulis silvestris]|uniref:Colicin I receptor n=1 Tax=Terricaulis silvestris TaxID=2686094 RepID=A0A6I6MGS6_9CAUL|nr:TonB-dependent receptor [Terricaulis silvestris]QGZ93529.1 Colicin I receptor precursor [Terricaulis silvestris]